MEALMEEKTVSYQVDNPAQAGDEGGQWVILELFGHKVIAGYMRRDETLGTPLLRLDVPETPTQAAFSRHYNPTAVYSISYVSEDVARRVSNSLAPSPITVYMPDLSEIDRLQTRNRVLTRQLALARGEDPEYIDEAS
jgi:hypothetical protein